MENTENIAMTLVTFELMLWSNSPPTPPIVKLIKLRKCTIPVQGILAVTLAKQTVHGKSSNGKCGHALTANIPI